MKPYIAVGCSRDNIEAGRKLCRELNAERRKAKMELIQKVKELIAALKANDYLTAFKLALEIITIISSAWGQIPRQNHAAIAAHAALSEAEIADSLQAEVERPGGPVIDTLLALALALIKKWLGF